MRIFICADTKRSKVHVSTDDKIEEEGDDESGPFSAKRLEQIVTIIFMNARY